MIHCTPENLVAAEVDASNASILEKMKDVDGLRERFLARHKLSKISFKTNLKPNFNPSLSSSLRGLPDDIKSGSGKVEVKELLSTLKKTVLDRKEVTDAIEQEVQARTQELYRKANFDALTHLPNRRHFNELVDGLVKKHQEHQHPFTLLFLDLDGFKKVNDSLGHAVGDELLRHVSARLLSSVRLGDVVARIGGDEFVVLLDETADKETIDMISKRIIREVSRSYFFDRVEVRVSTSIGIAKFPEDAATSAELVQNADEALYNAKQSGRRTYRFYGELSLHKPSHELISQARFDEAVANQSIEIKATPQVDLSGNRLIGAALTLEWPHSGLESDAFEAWSGLLQKSGWDHSVGRWLLDSAFYYLSKWQKSSPQMSVSVPVIEAVWRCDDFLPLLSNKVQELGLSPEHIHLVFDLKDLVSYDAFFVRMLKRLKAQGFKLTLKGYGEVQMDMSLMAGLEVDAFMMNRDWALNMHHNSNKNWVEALITMANVIGVQVVIKGELSIEEAYRFKQMGANVSEANQWLMTDKIDTFTQALAGGIISVA